MQEIIETKSKPVIKECQLSMTNACVKSALPVEHGLIVSGTTRFSMALDTNCSGTTSIRYVAPEFCEEMPGIFTFNPDSDVIELKEVPIEDAKKKIYDYLKSKPGARTSNIILDLGFDPDIVVEALAQLKSEDKVEGRPVADK